MTFLENGVYDLDDATPSQHHSPAELPPHAPRPRPAHPHHAERSEPACRPPQDDLPPHYLRDADQPVLHPRPGAAVLHDREGLGPTQTPRLESAGSRLGRPTLLDSECLPLRGTSRAGTHLRNLHPGAAVLPACGGEGSFGALDAAGLRPPDDVLPVVVDLDSQPLDPDAGPSSMASTTLPASSGSNQAQRMSTTSSTEGGSDNKKRKSASSPTKSPQLKLGDFARP